MRICLLLLLPAGMALTSCSEPTRIEITETRQLQPSEQQPKLDASARERFALSQMMSGVPQQDTRPVEPSQGSTRGSSALVWDTPEGWSEEPPTAMRDANLRFGENGEGECYVMQAGGSLEANANRWLGQLGLDPLTEEQIAALPTRSLFGIPAYIVDATGAYKGMGAAEAMEDYRLLGLILPVGNTGQSLFVKMVGPQALVDENESKFNAFCDSLKIRQGS